MEAMNEQNMLILFSKICPPDLAQYCIIHKNDMQIESLEVGQQIKIGEKAYTIDSVGSTALSQWNELGHVTLKFENKEDPLPGSIHLKDALESIPKVGDTISIL